MTRLSVIVPATDGPPTLARCVEAIRAGLEAHDELHVVTEPPRCHPSVARNLGVAQSTGDVLVFVDADVEVRSDALARLRAAFDRDAALAAAFGSYDDAPGDDRVRGRMRIALGAAAALVSLNHRFYRLLVRRLGAPSTGVGIVLHALHHVVGVVAVPVAVVGHLLSREVEARKP